MKLGKLLGSLFLCLLVLSACDDKKDEFSGLSNLVEERNQVRKSISKKNAQKKALEQQKSALDSKGAVALDKKKKKADISPIVLYERDVEVVDSSSKKALAKGIAYLNKEGRIIKIRIIKE